MWRVGKATRELFSPDWRGVVAVGALLLLLLVVITMPFIEGRESQLSAYDDDWNDISDFRRDVETLPHLLFRFKSITTTAASLTSLNETEAKDSVYMAIGIEREYSFAEWRAINEFQTAGGKVLIADDYGHGNSLLRFNGFAEDPGISHIGDTPECQYLFSGKRLSDVRVDRNPQLVRLTVPVYENLEYDVLLNDPSCFRENDDWSGPDPWDPWWRRADEAEILANSSENSWIDRDRDGVRDPGEKVGEYPVIIFQDEMLLIADPSIFTNDMYWRADNRAFIIAALTTLLPAGGNIIIDESIHIEPGLFSELDDTIIRPLASMFGEDWPVYSGLLALVIGLTGMAMGGRRGMRRYSPHRDRLGEPRTLSFGNPYNWLSDYYEVRGVLLQRMRYAYGLDPDDLQRLPPEMVARLLGDQYLVQFVMQPVRVDPEALTAALGDISSWQPPYNAEELVEHAENYLASLSSAAPAAWATPQWGRSQAAGPVPGQAIPVQQRADWARRRGGGY
jgi:hypothetical protein